MKVLGEVIQGVKRQPRKLLKALPFGAHGSRRGLWRKKLEDLRGQEAETTEGQRERKRSKGHGGF